MMADQLQLDRLVVDARQLSVNLVQVRQAAREVVQAPEAGGFREALESSKLPEVDIGGLLKGEGLAEPFVSAVKAALAFEQYVHDLELGPVQADPLENTGLDRESLAGLLPQAGVLEATQRFEELEGSINGVVLAFGVALLPVAVALAQAITPLLQNLAQLIVLNPNLAEGLAAAAAAFTVFRVAAMLAMNATGIGLLVTAVIAGVGLIVAYWEPLAAFFTQLATTVMGIWAGLGEWFSGVWQQLLGVARAAWEGIQAVLAWDPLPALLMVWTGLPTWIMGLIASVVDAVAIGWGRLREYFGWSPLPSLEQGWGAVTDYLGGWGEAVMATLDTVRAALGGLFDGSPLQALQQQWAPVQAWIKGWVEKISELLAPIAQFLGASLGAGLQGAGKAISEWSAPQAKATVALAGAVASGQPTADPPPRDPALQGTSMLASTAAASPAPSLIQQTADAQRMALDGSLLVRFDNAPAGISVVNTQSNQPGVSIRGDVGVRSLSQGAQP